MCSLQPETSRWRSLVSFDILKYYIQIKTPFLKFFSRSAVMSVYVTVTDIHTKN